MGKSKLDSYLLDNDMSLFEFNDELYREVVTVSNIEKFKLEKQVTKKIAERKKKRQIIRELNSENKLPVKIDVPDLHKFFARNRELTEDLLRNKKDLAKRHEDARLNLIKKMSKLTDDAEELIEKCKTTDNATAIIGAWNTLNKTWMNAANLMGLFDKKEEEQTVGVIKLVTDKKERLVNKLHHVNFDIVDGDTSDEIQHQ